MSYLTMKLGNMDCGNHCRHSNAPYHQIFLSFLRIKSGCSAMAFGAAGRYTKVRRKSTDPLYFDDSIATGGEEGLGANFVGRSTKI